MITGWYVDSSSGTTTDGRGEFLRMIDACLDHPDDLEAIILW